MATSKNATAGKKAGDGRGDDQNDPSKPNNGLQGHKLAVIRGKA